MLNIQVYGYPGIFLDIDWIATEMRPLTNETFVVFHDKVRPSNNTLSLLRIETLG